MGEVGRLRGYVGVKPGVLRLENKKLSLMSRAGEAECPSSRREREKENSPFLHLFVLFGPSVDWMMLPTLVKTSSYSVY